MNDLRRIYPDLIRYARVVHFSWRQGVVALICGHLSNCEVQYRHLVEGWQHQHMVFLDWHVG